jgi:glycosyltransferase involved in cell wall biosynthesis
MKLTIIMPTYNESDTLRNIVKDVDSVKYPIPHEIIIVDDASIDKSYEKAFIIKQKSRLEKNNVRVFKNRINHGKGFSIRRGIQHATGQLVVVQDGDTEYNPADIPLLLEPILKGEADVVIGSRFLKCKHPAGMAYPNLVANKLLTIITNILYGTKLTDVYTCYKVIPLEMLKSFRLRWDRFESEAEILGKVIRTKKRILEVPISYEGRTVEEGKKIKGKDFFYAVYVLFLERFFPTKKN